MGKGRWQGFVVAEDGSLLKVVGERDVIRPKNTVDPEAHVRAAFEANTYRREARRVRQNLRTLRGSLGR